LVNGDSQLSVNVNGSGNGIAPSEGKNKPSKFVLGLKPNVLTAFGGLD
jgi:hypothetical protein